MKEKGLSFSLFREGLLKPIDVEKIVLESNLLIDPLIDEAEKYFIKAILVDRKNYQSYYNYASFLFQLKRFDLAEECYLECLRLKPEFYPALYEVIFFLFFFLFF